MYMIKNFLSEALDQSCCIILRTRSFFKKKKSYATPYVLDLFFFKKNHHSPWPPKLDWAVAGLGWILRLAKSN